ncbi:MAG: 3-oxoacyl-[acyl-carrier-protein] reductase [Deltaproteobacteria bacterium]|nr:3-oxoacyl-[acyl-carrier-protein] reductase [Deltaproteobacteria bacterium]MBW1952152.1 3-oxoacyl-[acyl-carrier-protein] reductase [Deltaproteobacteria bacterium]MBW1986159.1 3-oxoacyl-[acyl-carrier-protein] reductase [Deltaproteobacteria bacterium]MBW2134913.1 3-oxoacyl-[acyl-carrier-protein] reductase [Deltaproteobacteria bacterium]
MSEIKRVALVTGAAQGIGRACVLALAQPQTMIYINDVANWDAAEKTRQAVQAQGAEAEVVGFDVSDFRAVSAVFEQIINSSGRLDILVNNAGIVHDNLVVRMKEEQWDRVLAVNLKGAYNCIRAVARPMIKQHYGRIINISSIVGVMGNPGQANYVASKAGLIGLTKAVARELASRQITVNAVAPGFIATEMTEALPEKTQAEMLAQIPLNRFGTPEEVAAVVAFLASEAAAYITGQVIHINGGMLMV